MRYSFILIVGGALALLLYGGKIKLPNNQVFSGPTFTDIYQLARLTRHPHTYGAAWFDYDNDGNLDLLLAGETPQLYRNSGRERFEILDAGITGSFRIGIFGDYNNDGCGDLFVAGLQRRSALYRNNCNGTFTDITASSGIAQSNSSWGAAWADYNNDGYLDLYVTNHGIFHATPDPKYLDYSFESNILYRNNGDGTFTDVTILAGVDGFSRCGLQPSKPGPLREVIKGPLKQSFQPIWFDYDLDGDVDLFVATDLGVSPLYRNDNGAFTEVTKEAGLCRRGTNMGVTVGDYDNDGDLDLYTTNNGANYLWRNNGDGTFSEVAAKTGTTDYASYGWGTEFFDYDNDGDLDLYVTNGDDGPKGLHQRFISMYDRIFENNGDGTFTEIASTQGIFGEDPKEASAFGDFNNDGFIDVAVISSGYSSDNKSRLYKNRGNQNNWLTLQLVGTKSNHDSVGAMIIVKSGTTKQIRQVISGSSYLSQNSLWQTFGLGAAKRADEIEIRWPSGITQRLKNIEANHKITVVEE